MTKRLCIDPISLPPKPKTRKTEMIQIRPGALELDIAAEYVSLSVSTVEKLVRESQFPKPRLLSGRRVGYLVRELDEWLEARPVSNLPPPPNTSRRGLSEASRQRNAPGGQTAL